MRLTCPNCGAQYEVPDDVIPPGGRDVQCSNCGDTWLAGGDEPEQEPAAQEYSAFEDYPEPTASGAAEEAAAPESEPEPEPAEPEEPEADPEPRSPLERRKQRLDPALAGILREEAARESGLREAEQSGLESQDELGLQEPEPEPDEAARRARESRDRMARLRGENPAEIEAEETGSRRGLLPDIEEINSTLRASGAPAPAPAGGEHSSAPRRGGSGFAAGFLFSLVLAAGLAAVYAKAPEIAKAVPQADPAVSSYVALVDQARIWLDGQLRAVMAN